MANKRGIRSGHWKAKDRPIGDLVYKLKQEVVAQKEAEGDTEGAKALRKTPVSKLDVRMNGKLKLVSLAQLQAERTFRTIRESDL
jgi:hypothetical protein